MFVPGNLFASQQNVEAMNLIITVTAEASTTEKLNFENKVSQYASVKLCLPKGKSDFSLGFCFTKHKVFFVKSKSHIIFYLV